MLSVYDDTQTQVEPSLATIRLQVAIPVVRPGDAIGESAATRTSQPSACSTGIASNMKSNQTSRLRSGRKQLRESRAPLPLDAVVAGDLVQRAVHHLADRGVFVLQPVTVDLQSVVDEMSVARGPAARSVALSKSTASVGGRETPAEWGRAVMGDPLVGRGDFFRCDRGCCQ